MLSFTLIQLLNPPPIKLQAPEAVFNMPPTTAERLSLTRLHFPPPIKVKSADAVFEKPPTIDVKFEPEIVFLQPVPIKL